MKTTLLGLHSTATPHLQRSLESIASATARPYDLVILCESADANQIKELIDASTYHRLITCDKLSAPHAFNVLISQPGYDYFVYLEDGLIVTPDWLKLMRAALDSDPAYGLAGPSTNFAWDRQRAGGAPADGASPRDIERFAFQVKKKYPGGAVSLEPLHSLGDFCYMVKKETVEAVGFADESYGFGPCWEMDYNIRAARAGYTGVWAMGAYVHRRSVSASRATRERELLDNNKKIYQRKFCAKHLNGNAAQFCGHCKGDDCADFAPVELIDGYWTTGEGDSESATATKDCPPIPMNSEANQGAHQSVCLTSENPFVTCIMPTYNRRVFAAKAIEYFERQDYPNRELLIVDDGTDSIADLINGKTNIRHIRLEGKRPLGAKRNMACKEATGELILHWDDDDWMAPRRIRRQVSMLCAARADVCGLNTLLFADPLQGLAWKYAYTNSRKPWVAGGTLCYTKETWRANRFHEITIGEDTRFVWSLRGNKIVAAADETLYVARIHVGNTSPKKTATSLWSSYPIDMVRAIIGADWNWQERRVDSKAAMRSHAPLVSCIMPTHDRPLFASLAAELFLRQDYPNKELVIVDDGPQPLHGIIPDDPRILLVRLEGKRILGEKRNIAVEHARGAYIVHWDDDDWYSPDRISKQMHALLRQSADVTALTMHTVLSMGGMRFWRCLPHAHARLHYKNVCCGTIAYSRNLWEQCGPYPEIQCAEDVAFLQKLPKGKNRIHRLDNNGLFICVRHDKNTWRIDADWRRQRGGWQPVGTPAFLPGEDFQRYGAIASMLDKNDHGDT
jgi:glycosyltransferase involved in cell wall biosynthesis